MNYHFRFFYEWVLHMCNGKNQCDVGMLPAWHEATDDSHTDLDNTTTCPENVVTYFTGALIHVACLGENYQHPVFIIMHVPTCSKILNLSF